MLGGKEVTEDPAHHGAHGPDFTVICLTGTTEVLNPSLALSSDMTSTEDVMNATHSTAQFVFNQGGQYKLCYKLKVLDHTAVCNPPWSVYLRMCTFSG